ncbi:protein apterous isoform X1 [Nilaparvata lugens]|uniref:protein apterous isoform X1 n=1 Tax=Nilaparvata lugens TaxID=108931 RepID=UPI00193E7343|nr:protein apterous isoform X1 [Nilaparvata lugens]
MGVYELLADSNGMHWQQQQQERPQMLAAAYDPSRDLSPNLPTTCHLDTPPVAPPCFKTETSTSSECHDCQSPSTPPEHHQSQGGPTGGPGGDEELVVCAGCGGRICDRYYLYAVDRRWHAACLQCSQCRRALDKEVTCFARDGSIFCKKDYYRLFGARRCGRCQASILSSELVMRARDRVFHVNCFSCSVCSAVLTKGDHFGMRDGAVFCRLHYHELPSPMGGGSTPDYPYHPHPHPPPMPSPVSAAPADPVKVAGSFFNGVPTPRQKGRPRKRKPKDLEGMTANLDLNADAYLEVAFGPGTPGMGGANGSHHQRTKRMRTSFKHHQLRTMKSYFAINHNPDAKDLKQLSQKTGLPKRVLQVWFQNARAKWRRMMMKQEGGGKGGSLDKCGDGSSTSLEAAYHLPSHSPQHYLSSSPLECSS